MIRAIFLSFLICTGCAGQAVIGAGSTINGGSQISGASGSSLPTPPEDAIEYSDLQTTSGWTAAYGSATGSPSCPSSSAVITTGVSSPSLTGSSVELAVTGSSCNGLAYLHLTCPSGGCTQYTHMLLDYWVYVSDDTQAQQLENDPDSYDGDEYQYFASTACTLVGSTGQQGFWRLWNMAGTAWEVTPYPCNSTVYSSGTWHHWQAYSTYDYTAKTYTYETVVFDGVTIFQNLGQTYSAGTDTYGGATAYNVQFQADITASGTALTEWMDQGTLWVW